MLGMDLLCTTLHLSAHDDQPSEQDSSAGANMSWTLQRNIKDSVIQSVVLAIEVELSEHGCCYENPNATRNHPK